MRTTSTAMSALVLLLAGTIEGADTEFALPDDPDTVVVRLTSWGPAMVPGTRIEILANGTILLPSPGGADEFRGRLRRSEFRDLIDYLLVDLDLRSIDTRELEEAIARAPRPGGGGPICLTGTVTAWRLELVLRDLEHRVEVETRSVLRSNPDIVELHAFRAAIHRLGRLALIARAGGPKEVETMVRIANAHLRENVFERRITLTPRHLVGFHRFDEKSSIYQFQWKGEGVAGVPGTRPWLDVEVHLNDDITVSVTNKL
jgi:hypothetical protein